MAEKTLSAAELEALEKLLEKATPGPLLLKALLDGRPYIEGGGLVGRSKIAAFCDDPEGHADAELYLTFRNAAPALLAAARREQKMRERVEELLEVVKESREYLIHKASRHDLYWRDCDSLLTKTWDALAQQEKP